MLKKVIQIFKKDKSLILIIAFIFGIFLTRIYQLDGYAMFLGDQARDAIIIKRIVTFEHFTAIGAVTSIGQVFLGPLYYYLVAPGLFLFNLDPVGLVYAVATISCVLLFTIYFFTKEIFGRQFAVGLLVAISFGTVFHQFARFSWNPNLLPYVSFLISLMLYKLLQKQTVLMASLLGISLSVAVQFHYIALILFLPVAGVFGYLFFAKRKEIITTIRSIVLSAISFAVVYSPLIIFDLRHNFLNSKNFFKLLTQDETVGGNRLDQISMVFTALNKFIFHIDLSPQTSLILLSVFCLAILVIFFRNRLYMMLGYFFVFLIVGLSLYSGPKYIHYLGIVYIYYLSVIIALILCLPKKVSKYALGIFLIVFSAWSISKYDFFHNDPNYQIDHARQVARSITTQIQSDKYQITALPERYSDNTYRYFLESMGRRPLEKDSLEKAGELFVICETVCDTIIGHPAWDIAYFAPRRVGRKWNVDGVTIYRLIR